MKTSPSMRVQSAATDRERGLGLRAAQPRQVEEHSPSPLGVAVAAAVLISAAGFGLAGGIVSSVLLAPPSSVTAPLDHPVPQPGAMPVVHRTPRL